MRKLTLKQRAFIKEYLRTKNGTQSALNVYDTINSNVAHSIASDNLRNPTVKKTIEQCLEAEGYSPEESIQRLRQTAKAGVGIKADGSDQIRADELLLKLSGQFIEKRQSVSVNLNLDSMNKEQLIKLKEKYDRLLKQ